MVKEAMTRSSVASGTHNLKSFTADMVTTRSGPKTQVRLRLKTARTISLGEPETTSSTALKKRMSSTVTNKIQPITETTVETTSSTLVSQLMPQTARLSTQARATT